MLKQSASGVLAALRGSTCPDDTPRSFTRYGLAGRPFCASRWVFSSCPRRADQWSAGVPTLFFRSLQGDGPHLV